MYLRALFLIAGILIAAGAVGTILYYRNHIHVQLVAGPLDSVVGKILVEVHQQRPASLGAHSALSRPSTRRPAFRDPVKVLPLPVMG